MSYLTRIYPATLPLVSSFSLKPLEERAAPDNGSGPRTWRKRSSSKAAAADVTWVMTNAQKAIAFEFYKTDLLNGNHWFLMPLPLDFTGRRFVVRLSEELTAKKNGFDAWNVSGTLEIDDRSTSIAAEVPPPLTLDLTSVSYSLYEFESVDAFTSFTRGNILESFGERLDLGAAFYAGALTRVVGYRSYTADAEDGPDVSVTFISGAMVRVVGYRDTETSEALDVSASFISGQMASGPTVSYRTYSFNESVSVSAAFLSGALT